MVINAISFAISAVIFVVFTRFVAPVSNLDMIIGVVIAALLFYPIRRLVARVIG